MAGLGVSQNTASPALPGWVLTWHQSCDALGEAMRAEEQSDAGL
jgi:hypothetical protein